MFDRNSTIRQYASVGLESKVLGASPHQLITLLYDGAIEALVRARGHLQAGQHAQAVLLIGKARNIILSGLRACLDRKQGGELAANLDALYDYMVRRLIEAGRGQPAPLDEVERLLGELRDAWQSIEAVAAQVAKAPGPPTGRSAAYA